MKTPDEIKRGMECCRDKLECIDCEYSGADCIGDMCADALSYIQQLEAQAPKWISVEERLPEEFANVIIWRNDCRNAYIGWLIGGHWSVPKGVRVTHWMPLPEPPEEAT